MSGVPKRIGRPPGAKNKRKGLSAETVQQICDKNRFCPVQKLVDIARDDDYDARGRQIEWPIAAQLKATEKLLDAIHNDKKLPGIVVDGDNSQQLSIAFIESGDSFTLSRESSAEGAKALLQSE